MSRPPLVVLGDTLLDRDVEGSVNRLCPDAPAPVLDERTTVDRPGGAGLAALLATGLGFDVALVTALADDAGGARLSDLLAAAGVRVHALPLPGATPEKIRLRSRGRVLLRHDRGGGAGPPGEPSAEVLELLATAAAVLVSDYGRGLAAQPTLRAALAGGRAPVVWDPHPRGPRSVPGVRLVTPNEAEARHLTGAAPAGPQPAPAQSPFASAGPPPTPSGPQLAVAARAAQDLRQRWRAAAVAVTLGARGALLCHTDETPLVVPAPAGVDGDPCGAGDRFAGAAAAALGRGALVSEAVEQAVREASAYVAAGGVANAAADPVLRVSGGADAPARPGCPQPEHRPDSRHREDDRVGAAAAGAVVARVRAAGGTVVATGGCFDLLHAGHLATLRAARRLGDCLVVCLNSDTSVAALKGPGRPLNPQADRAGLLAALECVDAVVVFDETTPTEVLSWLRPDVWVKGGDYATGGGPALPEGEILRRWGGHSVVVPYLDGRSTTATIAAARASGRLPAGGQS